MGVMALLLAACGRGGSETPRAPEVPSGEAGLEQVRVEAVDLLRELVPQITGATDLTVESAAGTYQSSGNAGLFYYEYSARAELAGGSPDLDAVEAILQDSGLEVSSARTPNGNPSVQGLGGGLDAFLFVDPSQDTARLEVVRSGARIEADPVAFPAERQAELRRETSIDLG